MLSLSVKNILLKATQFLVCDAAQKSLNDFYVCIGVQIGLHFVIYDWPSPNIILPLLSKNILTVTQLFIVDVADFKWLPCPRWSSDLSPLCCRGIFYSLACISPNGGEFSRKCCPFRPLLYDWPSLFRGRRNSRGSIHTQRERAVLH